MKLSKEDLKKFFPNIAKELDSNQFKINISSIRSDKVTGEKAVSKGYTHYVPDVIDYIRRCDNENQAEEIISYLERRGELDSKYARRLRTQLRKSGVRSFGAKKEVGYYLKHGSR